MRLFIKLIVIILFSRPIMSEDFSPYDGDTLDYIHVLFEWPQIFSGKIDYSLRINNVTTGQNWFSSHNINMFLLEDFLEWGMDYSWQVCYTSNFGNDCLEPVFFSINDLPSNHPDSVMIHHYDEDQYFPGLNLVVIFNSGNSFIMDPLGNPVAYINKLDLGEPSFFASQFLENGNIIGHSEIPLSGFGFELDLDGEIYFQTLSEGHHHDFIKSSRGTYFGIKNSWDYIENICEDQDPLFVYWQGDVFFEYDSSGNVIWEWDALDHLDYSEYNPDYCDGVNPDVIDWTHANSVHYDEKTNSVLVSFRNISRIVNINYVTGEINWQIGEAEFMDSVEHEIDFLFSGQHAAETLENGNILFFDNHSYLTPQISGCKEFSYDSTLSEFTKVWSYELDEELFGQFGGDCDRLENGHNLINTGSSGHLMELNHNNEIIWDISFYKDLQLMRLVRAQRIHNLYPIAFNIFFENYYNSIAYILDNNIHLKISNMGWTKNIFIAELKYNEHLIFTDSTHVSNNNQRDWLIETDNTLSDSLTYELKVYPADAPHRAKKFNVILSDSLPNSIIPSDNIHIQSAYPNPFNNSIKIKFSIPVDGDVLITIYNITGQEVDQFTLLDLKVGNHTFDWNAYNQTTGVYILKLSLDRYSNINKITLIK